MIKLTRFSKSYKAGDTILEEKPFAFLLNNDQVGLRCDYCFKRTELKICSGCHFVHYCERNCQKTAWNYHKYECPNFKKVYPKVVPDAVRMIIRILIKLKNGGANEKSYYTETKFRTFKDLMSHYKDIKMDKKRMEHFVAGCMIIHEFLGDTIMLPNKAELLAIFGKMIVNTFNIDQETQNIGMGLYLGASVIDHSCNPNAIAVFHGTKLIIKTIVDIDSLDWMKVRISYIELLNLPSERQQHLRKTYYFNCDCARCKDVEELKLMMGTICQNTDCRKTIKGGALESIIRCSHCNKLISPKTKEIINESIKYFEEKIKLMESTAYLDICRFCLKKQENLFDDLNIYTVKMLDLAMDACIDIENWEEGFEYGKRLIESLKVYYKNMLHPVKGIFYQKLGKLASFLDKKEEARMYFKTALSILSITHSHDTEFLKQCMRDCDGLAGSTYKCFNYYSISFPPKKLSFRLVLTHKFFDKCHLKYNAKWDKTKSDSEARGWDRVKHTTTPKKSTPCNNQLKKMLAF